MLSKRPSGSLFYLGLFTLAACTATRAGRIEWLAGLTVGLTAVTVIAVFAFLQPGTLASGTSDLPNSAGRLSYPVGYWNGAAALLASTATLLAYAADRAPWRAGRAVATAAIPVAMLALWLTHSEVATLPSWSAGWSWSLQRPRRTAAAS